jgi:hypothetical protein
MTTESRDAAAEHELSDLVACALTDMDLKTQRERWINLVQHFAIARSETDEGLRLAFKRHPAVEAELRALVEVENECCSWATWSVERSDEGELVMAARSQGDGIAALHGMFRSATPWSRPE